MKEPIYKKVQVLTNIGYEYIEHSNGSKSWYKDGLRHRTNGPAIIYSNGTEEWYLNDLRHRIDGPAIIGYDGTKIWWLNDTRVPEDKFNQVLNAPLKELPLYINTIFEPIVKERLLNAGIL